MSDARNTDRDVYTSRRSYLDLAREYALTLLLVSIYIQLLYRQISFSKESLRWDVILFTLKVSLEMVFFLIRRHPKEFSYGPRTTIIVLGSLATSMLLLPCQHRYFPIFGTSLIQIGILIHMWSLVSLGRSFGIIPANRGVVSSGLYRMVRHPLYLSVIVTILGYSISNPSRYNLFIFMATAIFHILRIEEEEHLLSRDPAYRCYRSKVPYRLFPYIW